MGRLQKAWRDVEAMQGVRISRPFLQTLALLPASSEALSVLTFLKMVSNLRSGDSTVSVLQGSLEMKRGSSVDEKKLSQSIR